MTKPMGASRPPTSVAESEEWIRADKDRESRANSWKLNAILVPLLAVFFGLVLYSMFAMAGGLASWGVNPIVAFIAVLGLVAWWIFKG